MPATASAQKRGGDVREACRSTTISTSSRARPPAAWSNSTMCCSGSRSNHPRAAKVVELRVFGGLSIEETPRAALDVAESTISEDWRFARAWLARELPEHAPKP
jgi:hypothetical protein